MKQGGKLDGMEIWKGKHGKGKGKSWNIRGKERYDEE